MIRPTLTLLLVVTIAHWDLGQVYENPAARRLYVILKEVFWTGLLAGQSVIFGHALAISIQ